MLILLALIAAAHAQEAFSFAVVGDTQSNGTHWSINWDELPLIVEAANEHEPSFLIVAGDLVAGSGSVATTASQWADFVDATAPFVGTVLPVPGNHDVYGGVGTFAAWRDTFDWLPRDDSPEGEEGVSYYVDYGNTRFVMITSDGEEYSYMVSPAGMVWLDSVLSESDGFDHVFVTTHHPVTFSDDNYHGGTLGDFWQTLVAYGVTGLFTGHWHRYQPSQPGAGGESWETILGTGGGWRGFSPIRAYQQIPGFVLVEVDGARAEATFYSDEDGDGEYDDVADTFTLAHEGASPHGLRGRYTFDAGTADDSAPTDLGAAVHGALGGGASVTESGASGMGLSLEGGSDYVEAGNISDYVLAITGDLTVSLWAQSTTVPPSGSYGSALLCYATNDYYTEDEETNYSYWLSLRSDGILVGFWEYGSGSNVYLESTEAIDLHDGAWHHIAMVRHSAEMNLRFYMDGVQLGDAVGFSALPTGGGRGMLYLGSDTAAYVESYNYVGSLDEVCIYDMALDGDAVGALAGMTDCVSVIAEEDPDTGTPGDTGGSADTGDTSAPSGDSGEGEGEGEGDSGEGEGEGEAEGDSGEGEGESERDPLESGLTEDDSTNKSGCGCGALFEPSGGLAWFASLIGWARRRRESPYRAADAFSSA